MKIGERFKNAWNAFIHNTNPYPNTSNSRNGYYGSSNFARPDRIKLSRGGERTIIASIYNRISMDVAANTIQHVKLDDNERFVEVVNSGLNNCLNLEANLDQTGRSFIQDMVMSMFDEGVAVMVPIDTDRNPADGSFDIYTMRVGKVVQWSPYHVRVRIYNDRTGQHQELLMRKDCVGIVENPFYAVMNEPNSTLQRLIRKLKLLDQVDEATGSSKLDLIIQLPYIVRTEARRKQAEQRKKDIEMQLTNSRLGIAYTDATEHITQLNRSLENNLMPQIEYLTNLLYSQLGITKEIFDGSADERALLNYHNRTIEPILSAICDEMKRKFLTKTARTQRQSIFFFKDPFRLVPVSDIAQIADTFTRNEILTSNELRQIIGMKPSNDPKADMLVNSNMPQQGMLPGQDSGQDYDSMMLEEENMDPNSIPQEDMNMG